MSFGNILGQILQGGLGGQTQTRGRVEQTANNLDRQGGGIGDIFAQLQGALGGTGATGTASGGAAGGFADKARDFMQKDQVGGLSGMQVGGIGAAAGALLGGGIGGAARGGVMAVLGTLALGALKSARAGSDAGTGAVDPQSAAVSPQEVKTLTSPDNERLILKAMISAAKADGTIDQEEVQKIIGKISGDSVTAEEKQFVLDEMRAPLDINALASAASTPAQAAQIYAASLLAIDVDSDAERQYLADLAAALKVDPAAVAKLHEMTGAPA